jgi:hypothetical protein
MAKFFAAGGLPRINDVRDVYAYARELHRRGIPILKSEERFVRQLTYCMLQIQDDQQEGELHQALARVAALALAIIEDDDFDIPEGVHIRSRVALEGLAVALQRQMDQQELELAATIGVHGLDVTRSDDLDAIEKRLPRTPELDKALRAARIHLRQGEKLLAGQRDEARAAKQRERLQEAYDRAARLIARLVGVPPTRDHPVVRAHIIRRELRHIEVDALGVERLTEHEQARRTRELLAWTEEDLGQSFSDDHKAELAERLRAVAAEQDGDADSGDWFFAQE